MGWDGSGNFNRTNGVFTGVQLWQDSRDGGRRIRADDHDTHDQDLADGLENTVTRDGQNQPSANLPMANFRHTSVGNAVARNDYTAAGQVQDSDLTFVPAASVGGTADAITLTPSPAISAYAAGQRFQFVVEANNTGAVTLNVSGLGTRALTKIGTGALEADDIVTGTVADVFYDGTQFQLLNLIGTDAAIQNTLGLVIGTDIAGINTANTFTNTQTIDRTGGAAILTQRSDQSTVLSPVAQGFWVGHNSSAADTTYASYSVDPVVNTAGSETGRIRFLTRVNGASQSSFIIEDGIRSGNPTGGDQGTGSVNATEYYENGNRMRPIVAETVTATTSGTSHEYTGIPSGIKRITVILDDVGLSGSEEILCQIGDSGGFETSGYDGGVDRPGTTSVSNSSGWHLNAASINARHWSGLFHIVNITGDRWIISGQAVDIDSLGTSGGIAVGGKTLSATLDRIRIIRSGASDTFDQGQFNILYEF